MYFGEREPLWLIFSIFFWTWTHFWTEHTFTELRHSKVKYKPVFYQMSSPPSPSSLLKLPIIRSNASWALANRNQTCHQGILLFICISRWRNDFLKLNGKQWFYHLWINKMFKRKVIEVLFCKIIFYYVRASEIHVPGVNFRWEKIIVAVVINGAFRSEI